MQTTSLKPFGRNIWIEPEKSKMILGESLCEYGKVIAVGDEVEKIKVGDTIGYLSWGVNHISVDGNKYYIIPCSDEFILAHLIVASEPVQTDLSA